MAKQVDEIPTNTNAANVASPTEAAYLASVDGFPVPPIPGVAAKEPEVVKSKVEPVVEPVDTQGFVEPEVHKGKLPSRQRSKT